MFNQMKIASKRMDMAAENSPHYQGSRAHCFCQTLFPVSITRCSLNHPDRIPAHSTGLTEHSTSSVIEQTNLIVPVYPATSICLQPAAIHLQQGETSPQKRTNLDILRQRLKHFKFMYNHVRFSQDFRQLYASSQITR